MRKDNEDVEGEWRKGSGSGRKIGNELEVEFGMMMFPPVLMVIDDVGRISRIRCWGVKIMVKVLIGRCECQQTVKIVRSTVVVAAGSDEPEKVVEISWSGPRFCSD